MKIEFLYPELSNQFGEIGHQRFLQKMFPKAEFVMTQLLQKPTFLDGSVDLVFMGPSSERAQEKIIDNILPHREAVKDRIEKGDRFLLTGNAMEIFGTSILNEDGTAIAGLDLFSMQARRQMMNRLTELYVGLYEDIKVTGVKTQFTQNFPKEPRNFPYLFQTTRGFGMNKELEGEGIHYKNFVATYVTGPLLIMNPLFTERLFQQWNIPVEIPYREALLEAYEIRVVEYEDPHSYT